MKLLPLFGGVYCLAQVRAILLTRRTSEIVLEELGAAVHSGDGQAVVRLTDELRVLVPVNVVSKNASRASFSSSPPSFEAPHVPVIKFLGKDIGKSNYEKVQDCASKPSLFEDTLFKISPKGKQELQKQLESEPIAQAISWIQTGGYYHCAYEGQSCKCAGNVRYGTPQTQRWSAVKLVSDSVMCSAKVFGDPAPGQAKQCGCHRSEFALEKHENSVSLLQESWIFLLRLLARLQLLPFTGDRRYKGIELWSARHDGKTGGTLERYWIEKYIVEQMVNIPGGNCLEWGFYYVNWLHQCTGKYENRYEPVKYGQKSPSVEGNVIYSSIYDFPAVIGPTGLQFNFICATELFEHLEKPYEAAADLMHILAPGGAVLITVPQQAQYHMVPQDFLRYTKEAVMHIFTVAGFCVPPELMAGSGDFIFDVGRNTGLQVQDFTIEELDEGYQRGYDSIADGAITIHAMAFKPPHIYCRGR
mmetsp:Transcript_71906/g.113952  ORF Transcript_71906/g.113952 Transcript_71906/m.113952 type:complete len:473 (-) Transcript_71906:101-1519(-)